MKNLKYIVLILAVFLIGCAASKSLTLTDRGYMNMSEGNTVEAEKDFKEALSLDPNNSYALFNLGVLYQKTNRPEQAREMYGKVIKIGGGEKSASSAQMETAIKAEKADKTDTKLQKDTVVKAERATQKQSGDTLVELAKENLQIISKDDWITVTDRGYMNMSEGKTVEAEKDFKEALSLDPNNSYALFNLGVLYQKTNRPEQAIEMYEKVIKIGGVDKSASKAQMETAIKAEKADKTETKSQKDTVVKAERATQRQSGDTLVELAKENLQLLKK